MAKKPKLTPAQKDLLRDIAENKTKTCIDTYKPAQKLAELGLITRQVRHFARADLSITDAGREYLA